MRAYVDADHVTDTMTQKSRTGFLVFLNSAPIYWMSKKQASVETSSFGSEFCVMKRCAEYVRGLRYKLRMMGISLVGSQPLFKVGIIGQLFWTFSFRANNQIREYRNPFRANFEIANLGLILT
jgi:hypothetical protein